MVAFALALPAATRATTAFTVNVAGDSHDANPGDGVCADAIGNCTLRAAIEEANALAGKQTILFNLPLAGGQPKPIIVESPLPFVEDPVIVNGGTQPGGRPPIMPTTPGTVSGLTLDGPAAGSTIRDLALSGFRGTAIEVGAAGAAVASNVVAAGSGPVFTTGIEVGADSVLVAG